jgi:Spy/CpxP family protein refolding chaperone
MMGHHTECPGGPGAHHEGGEAWEHHQGPDAERMAHHGHRGGRDMTGWGERGPGPAGGDMGPGRGQDVMRELASLGVHFYPPEMLLRRAQKIGLTPDQVTKIRQEMLGMQAHAVDLLAKLGRAKIDATRLLAAEKIDEHAVDAQIDEAAKVEAEMHKLRVGEMLRVRAILTPEQRQKLEERTPTHEGPKPAPGAAGQTSGAVDEADDDDDDDDADG